MRRRNNLENYSAQREQCSEQCTVPIMRVVTSRVLSKTKEMQEYDIVAQHEFYDAYRLQGAQVKII
jgi:hypothetical protein